MIEGLALAITLVCLAAGVIVGLQVAGGVFRWARLAPTLGLVQLALVVQAVLDVVGLARGHRPDELATHVAYLVVSLLILPVAAAQTQHDNGRWAGVLNCVALAVVAVLVVRMQTTWRTHRG